MTNETIQSILFAIVLLAVIGLTVRAIYGLFAWQGRRKKALIQAVGFPIGGFVLLMIVAGAFPATSPERAAAIAERTSEAEARAQAQAEAEAAEAERVAQAERIAEAEAAAQAEAERVAQAEAEAVELEACRQDLGCWGEKYSIEASFRCQRTVERSAQFDMRWTDSWIEPKFSRYRWENQDDGLITYIGDKAQFQNGFGAWQNVIYFCTYDPTTDSAVSIEVEAGRLP